LPEIGFFAKMARSFANYVAIVSGVSALLLLVFFFLCIVEHPIINFALEDHHVKHDIAMYCYIAAFLFGGLFLFAHSFMTEADDRAKVEKARSEKAQ
ncbi:unnamed protein product, partial [Polarella glacialis]